MDDMLKIVLGAIFSFLLLFIVAKILGKKQIVELDFVDYVIGISLGSISAEWATETDKPWYYFVISIVIFTVLSLLLTFFSRKTPFLKKVLQGSPIILISSGTIVYKNLKHSKLSVNDLLGMCRDKNYFNLNEIAYAILETSGNLSILPQASSRPTMLSDLSLPDYTPSSLPVYLIIDGRVFKNELDNLQKTQDWLMKKLNCNSEDDLKNILLAVYNKDTDALSIHTKDATLPPPLK